VCTIVDPRSTVWRVLHGLLAQVMSGGVLPCAEWWCQPGSNLQGDIGIWIGQGNVIVSIFGMTECTCLDDGIIQNVSTMHTTAIVVVPRGGDMTPDTGMCE
jgi:hypothetical protein